MKKSKWFLAKVLGGTISGTLSLLYLPKSLSAEVNPEAIKQLDLAPWATSDLASVKARRGGGCEVLWSTPNLVLRTTEGGLNDTGCGEVA